MILPNIDGNVTIQPMITSMGSSSREILNDNDDNNN
jgi:hypothetical protein